MQNNIQTYKIMSRLSLALVGTLMCGTVYASSYDAIYESLTSTDVVQRAIAHDRDAITELGHRSPELAIPILQQIIAQPIPSEQEALTILHISSVTASAHKATRKLIFSAERAIYDAKVSLARLGDQKTRDEFIVCLSSSSKILRLDCMSAIGEARDQRAVKSLMLILDETDIYDADPKLQAPPPLMATAKNQRELAAYTLSEILPEVYNSFKEPDTYSVATQAKWKAWWKENNKIFEK